MRRRAVLATGVAAAAAATGAGFALWRVRGAEPAPDIWAMDFETPQGARLALAPMRGRPLLLNFWATWCPPCVAELPLLDRFHREQRDRGWQVVGLAVDNLAPVIEFLGKRPVGFPIGLAGLAGVDLSRRLGNASGALPFSVVFDRSGRPRERRLGVIQLDDLRSWVATVH